MKIFGSKKSFTLVEILIYVAVLAVVILAVSSFFIWTIYTNLKARAMREVLYNAERALTVMTQEIKEAKSIYTSTSIFDTHPGRLSLETTKYLPEGEETTFVDFYLCNGQLCFKKESQKDPIVLTSDQVKVDNLIFTQIISGESSSVQINLKIDYESTSLKPEYQSSITLTSAASLRAF